MRAYLDVASRIGDLGVERPGYGDLVRDDPVCPSTFREFLRIRAARSLAKAGAAFTAVDPAALAAALPEPSNPALVHLDAFAGNMLAKGEVITGVVDFGIAIVGDRRLDPLTAAAYLTPWITPTATEADGAVADEWLAARGLAEIYEPARRWVAAYWSGAVDDVALHRWCRSVLIAP